MTSATIGRKSAASCLNRLQRPFDAASTRYRQTEALLAGGRSRTDTEAALHAAHTAVTFRAGTLQRKIELLGQRGPPETGGAGRSAVPTEGSTSPAASTSAAPIEIRAKLGVAGRGEAAAIAHRLGLDKQ
jgi:hypothetical protein